MRIKIIRLLSFVIDIILIMLPVQLVLIGLIGVNISQATMLFCFLMAVCSSLFEYYMQGQTLGKYFGKIAIIDSANAPPALLYIGMRELVKSFYFIPYIGIVLAIISIVMLFAVNKTLHDIVGQTKVVSLKERKHMLESYKNND